MERNVIAQFGRHREVRAPVTQATYPLDGACGTSMSCSRSVGPSNRGITWPPSKSRVLTHQWIPSVMVNFMPGGCGRAWLLKAKHGPRMHSIRTGHPPQKFQKTPASRKLPKNGSLMKTQFPRSSSMFPRLFLDLSSFVLDHPSSKDRPGHTKIWHSDQLFQNPHCVGSRGDLEQPSSTKPPQKTPVSDSKLRDPA